MSTENSANLTGTPAVLDINRKLSFIEYLQKYGKAIICTNCNYIVGNNYKFHYFDNEIVIDYTAHILRQVSIKEYLAQEELDFLKPPE